MYKKLYIWSLLKGQVQADSSYSFAFLLPFINEAVFTIVDLTVCSDDLEEGMCI
jgi:hypothetical protein